MVSKIEEAAHRMGEIASCIPEKGLIIIIYRELKILNYPIFNDPMKKWAKELNRTFSKKKIKCLKNM
jgi:hypothetical protein